MTIPIAIKDEICKLYLADVPVKEIAQSIKVDGLSIHKQTVLRLVRQRRLPCRHRLGQGKGVKFFKLNHRHPETTKHLLECVAHTRFIEGGAR